MHEEARRPGFNTQQSKKIPDDNDLPFQSTTFRFFLVIPVARWADARKAQLLGHQLRNQAKIYDRKKYCCEINWYVDLIGVPEAIWSVDRDVSPMPIAMIELK